MGPIPDRTLTGRVAQVLHSKAFELDAGRPVPRDVRRAVRGQLVAGGDGRILSQSFHPAGLRYLGF